jgi:hypothetical protein
LGLDINLVLTLCREERGLRSEPEPERVLVLVRVLPLEPERVLVLEGLLVPPGEREPLVPRRALVVRREYRQRRQFGDCLTRF